MFKWLKKKKTAVQKNEVRQMALQALVLPEIDIAKVKEFAMNGWELGETHGLPHWQRVERNGIILSTEIRNGISCIREDINMKVVRMFAYLHDKCRLNNGADLEHGIRAADMLPSIRSTILQDLTDEDFSLLEIACRLHTTELRTGNLTVDTCFDADRLDLERVGIIPFHNKMATANGKYWAMHLDEFHQIIFSL
mgnify:CR=1 FL=1|jgi:uncharacterized protein